MSTTICDLNGIQRDRAVEIVGTPGVFNASELMRLIKTGHHVLAPDEQRKFAKYIGKLASAEDVATDLRKVIG